MIWMLLLLQDLQGAPRSVEASESGAIQVNVPLAKGASLVTCVVLPEETIRSVVAAWDESEISIEHNGARLFLKLLAQAKGYVDVVGGSGKLYRLLVTPVMTGTFDETLTIKKRAAPQVKAPRSEALDLILAMRRGERPEGMSVSKGPQDAVYCGPTIKTWFRHIYRSDRFVGIVATAENITQKTIALDLSRFHYSGLVLVGAKELSIAPGQSTLVYLVISEDK